MSKKPGRSLQPLLVYHAVWSSPSRWYKDRKGKKVVITWYQEARDYAATNGYNGIAIVYT